MEQTLIEQSIQLQMGALMTNNITLQAQLEQAKRRIKELEETLPETKKVKT